MTRQMNGPDGPQLCPCPAWDMSETIAGTGEHMSFTGDFTIRDIDTDALSRAGEISMAGIDSVALKVEGLEICVPQLGVPEGFDGLSMSTGPDGTLLHLAIEDVDDGTLCMAEIGDGGLPDEVIRMSTAFELGDFTIRDIDRGGVAGDLLYFEMKPDGNGADVALATAEHGGTPEFDGVALTMSMADLDGKDAPCGGLNCAFFGYTALGKTDDLPESFSTDSRMACRTSPYQVENSPHTRSSSHHDFVGRRTHWPVASSRVHDLAEVSAKIAGIVASAFQATIQFGARQHAAVAA